DGRPRHGGARVSARAARHELHCPELRGHGSRLPHGRLGLLLRAARRARGRRLLCRLADPARLHPGAGAVLRVQRRGAAAVAAGRTGLDLDRELRQSQRRDQRTRRTACARVNRFILMLSLVTLVLFMVVGLAALYHGQGAGGLTLRPVFDPARFSPATVAAATSIAVLSFLGFDAVSTLAEESRGGG